MNFIHSKVRMIPDMTPSYIMPWKKINFKKFEDFEPIDMSSIELKTAAAIIAATKSVEAQRAILVELMFTVTEDSFSELCEILGETLMNKMLPPN